MLTRDRAIPVLANVVVAIVTRTVRGLPTEVELGPEHGVDTGCVINCDNLLTVAKSDLGRLRGSLDAGALRRLRVAMLIALDLQ